MDLPKEISTRQTLDHIWGCGRATETATTSKLFLNDLSIPAKHSERYQGPADKNDFLKGELPLESILDSPSSSELNAHTQLYENFDAPQLQSFECTRMQLEDDIDDDMLESSKSGAKERSEGFKLPTRYRFGGLQKMCYDMLESPSLLKSPSSATGIVHPKGLEPPSSRQGRSTFDSLNKYGARSTEINASMHMQANIDHDRVLEDMELVSSDSENELFSRSSGVSAENQTLEKLAFTTKMSQTDSQGNVASSMDCPTKTLDYRRSSDAAPSREGSSYAKAKKGFEKSPVETQGSPELVGNLDQNNFFSHCDSSSPKDKGCTEQASVTCIENFVSRNCRSYKSPTRYSVIYAEEAAAGLSSRKCMEGLDREDRKDEAVQNGADSCIQFSDASESDGIPDGISKADSPNQTDDDVAKAVVSSQPKNEDARNSIDEETLQLEKEEAPREQIHVTVIANSEKKKHSSPPLVSRPLNDPLDDEISPGLPSVNLDESAFSLDNNDDCGDSVDTSSSIGGGDSTVSPLSKEAAQKMSTAGLESVAMAVTSPAAFLLDSPASSSSSSHQPLLQHSLEIVPSFPGKGPYGYHFRVNGRFEEPMRIAKRRRTGSY